MVRVIYKTPFNGACPYKTRAPRFAKMTDLGKGVLLKRFGHEGYGFQARYPYTLMPKLFDGIKFEFVRGKCVVFVILSKLTQLL